MSQKRSASVISLLDCATPACKNQFDEDTGGFYGMDCCDHTICMSCAVPGFPESCPSCGKCIKSVLPVGYHKVGRRGKDSLEYDSIDILENKLSSVTIMNDGIKTTINLGSEREGAALLDDEKAALLLLFTFLHNVLVKPLHSSTKVDPNKDLENSNVDDQIFELLTQDDSLLLQCFNNLAMGAGVEMDKSNIRQQYQCLVAKENIARAANNKGSGLRSILGRFIELHGGSKSIQSLMCKLGISHSTSTTKDNNTAMHFESLRAGANVSGRKLDLVTVAFDNVGFKWRQGVRMKKSYLNYTLIKVIFIPYQTLKDRGLYPDPQHPEKLKSWEGKDWADEKEKADVNGDTVLLPNEDDLEQLAKVHYSVSVRVLSLAEKGILPSVKECKERLRNNERITVCSDMDDIEQLVRNNEASFIDHNSEKTIYDFPLNKDPAKKETIADLMRYAAEQIRRRVLESDSEHFMEGIAPIMTRVPISLATDGGPCKIAEDLLLKDESIKSLPVEPVPGGFHLMLEVYKKMGPMFYNTHLRDIIKLWRESEKQIKWITEPSDPNQSEAEYDTIHLAIVHAALLGVIAQKKRENSELNALDIAPNDILNHMINCSKKNPRCAAMLLQVRFLEILMMLRSAEKQSDTKKFMSAAKFSEMLFANANAYNYVFMILSFIVRGYCKSEADLEVLEFILFRRTVNGKSIFTDRSVEWSMKIVRTFVGRYYNSALDDRFNALINQLNLKPDFAKKTKSKSGSIDGGKKEDELEFNSIYMETLVMLDESRMWYHGEDQILMPAKRFKLREQRPGETKRLPTDMLTAMSNDDPLKSDVLFIFSRARMRLNAVFDDFKIDPSHIPNVGTRFAFPDTANNKLKDLYATLRTTSAQNITKNFKYGKASIMDEIRRHCGKLSCACPNMNGKTKAELAKTCVNLRKERIKAIGAQNNEDGNTRAGDEIVELWDSLCIQEYVDATSDIDSGESMMARLGEELKDPIITLDNTPSKGEYGIITFKIHCKDYYDDDEEADAASCRDDEIGHDGQHDNDNDYAFYMHDSQFSTETVMS